MEITINARHCKVSDALRNQATQRIARFERLDRRVTAATLVVDAAPNGGRLVEARLAAAGGPPLVSHAEGATARAALNTALDRLERQLKRRRDRLVGRRYRRPGSRDLIST